MASKKPKTEDGYNAQRDFEAGYNQDTGLPPMGGYPGMTPPVPQRTTKMKKTDQYKRQGYYLDPEDVEALHIYAFEFRKDKSEVVREMFKSFFGEERMQQARESLAQKQRK